MAGTRISERLPPILDRTQAPVAFGQRALPRLAAELQDGERSVRQRALAALRDLIHDPERAYEAVHHGMESKPNKEMQSGSFIRCFHVERLCLKWSCDYIELRESLSSTVKVHVKRP